VDRGQTVVYRRAANTLGLKDGLMLWYDANRGIDESGRFNFFSTLGFGRTRLEGDFEITTDLETIHNKYDFYTPYSQASLTLVEKESLTYLYCPGF